MLRKLFKLLSSRLFWFAILMAFQFCLLLWAVYYYSALNAYILLSFLGLSFFTALFVATRDEQPAYKMSWLLILLIFPLAGAVLFVIFGKKKIGKRSAGKIINTRDLERYKSGDEGAEGLVPSGPMTNYITTLTGYSAWGGTECEYFAFADDFVEDLLQELEKAEKFIFIEYFIIGRGEMWSRVLDVLKRKLAQGLDIRILYDDLGSINSLPMNYAKELRSLGFQAQVFNPVALHMNPRLNYRDHRKIFDIDGNICYTGGLNLADEYDNRTLRFGYWKDNAVKMKGAAVWNMTVMFLTVWRAVAKKEENLDLYSPTVEVHAPGLVQPFADSPFDDDAVARNVYMQAINGAREYVWIVTPYLILDSEMTTALTVAARSGVDVRIVTPHQPDKKSVHEVTRSQYGALLAQGVKIYEYLPGFIHQKTLVADGKVALVGTANLDYRSFYLHFELSVLFDCGSPVVGKVEEDTLYALSRSDEQTLDDIRRVALPRRLLRTFLSFFAPAL